MCFSRCNTPLLGPHTAANEFAEHPRLDLAEVFADRSGGDADGVAWDLPEPREYDRYGDRWSRDGRTFEYLCKPCHRDCCHQPRDGLEETLVGAGAGQVDRDAFLAQFCDLLDDDGESTRTGPE